MGQGYWRMEDQNLGLSRRATRIRLRGKRKHKLKSFFFNV